MVQKLAEFCPECAFARHSASVIYKSALGLAVYREPSNQPCLGECEKTEGGQWDFHFPPSEFNDRISFQLHSLLNLTVWPVAMSRTK